LAEVALGLYPIRPCDWENRKITKLVNSLKGM